MYRDILCEEQKVDHTMILTFSLIFSNVHGLNQAKNLDAGP